MALREPNMPSFNLHQQWAHTASILLQILQIGVCRASQVFCHKQHSSACKYANIWSAFLLHIMVLRHTWNAIVWAHSLLLLHRSSANTVLLSPAWPQHHMKSTDGQRSAEKGRDQQSRKQVHMKREQKGSYISLGRESKVFEYFEYICRDVGSTVFSTCPADHKSRHRLKAQYGDLS